ncbi:MAG: cytochrome b [Candidatus Pacebacteria bacterium]|jgi:cytochrome b561|nr:cytochrome b [Candidatus Paceibacterota bacterium]
MKSTQYHPISKFLHWSVVALVVMQFINSEFMPEVEDGGVIVPDVFLNTHFAFGAIILIPAVLLFLMRYLRPVEKAEELTPNLQTTLAVAMHYALYILLVAVPLSGWMAASAAGLEVNLFGFYKLPALVAVGSPSGEFLGEAHGFLASTLELLAIGHVAAALWHHFILKDNVLNRMRPFVTVK